MSTGERQPLVMPATDSLEDFAPRQNQQSRAGGPKNPPQKSAEAFPSREASPDGQLGIKGPKHVLERFKALCKEERWPMHAMLEILMDSYDSKKG